MGLDNLTTAPLEEPGKLIFASCQKDFPSFKEPDWINSNEPISCTVPGASPGDNVVVSSTKLDRFSCTHVASSRVSEPNVVSILLQRHDNPIIDGAHDHGGFTRELGDHDHGTWCNSYGSIKGTMIFSIIVFRPEVLDIIGTLEELRKLVLDKQ